MSDLNLRPVASASSSSKPIPASSVLRPWKFDYSPSPDGKDLNLLIMMHGLGDTKGSFTVLGRKLNLPSTAILSLQAPDPLPLMDTPSFSWYNTFTPLFEPLPNPSPAKVIPQLRSMLETLTSEDLGWELNQIHLFGYAQGGTTALELCLDVGKSGIGPSKARRLGSAVSVHGPLISFPSAPLNLSTPVLYFTRSDPRSQISQKVEGSLRRAFDRVDVVRGRVVPGGAEDMPRGKEEWQGIMKFWGELLNRDEGWKGTGDVFEVVR